MQQESTDRAKTYANLTVGDFVLRDNGSVYEVTHKQTWRDGNGRQMVAATVTATAGLPAEPEMWKQYADRIVLKATPEQVEHARSVARRSAVAAGLERLAREIRQTELPIPTSGLAVTVWLDLDRDFVRWASTLGGQITNPTKANRSVSADLGASGVAPVVVSAYGPALAGEEESQPDEVAQEWFFTFGAGHAFDGRYVRIFGTYGAARAVMVQVFGQAWCAQYSKGSFRAEGLPGLLVELPESEWPQTGDQADKDCPDAWHTGPVEPTEPCPACGDSAQPSIDLNRTVQADEAVTFVVTVTDEERAAIQADAEASRAATLAYREERRRRTVALVNEVEARRAQQAGE